MTFEEKLLNASDAEIVRLAIDRLSPSLKETIILHYFMEQPLRKIARLLAVPEGTVKFRLHYARKILAGILAEKLKRPLVLALATGRRRARDGRRAGFGRLHAVRADQGTYGRDQMMRIATAAGAVTLASCAFCGDDANVCATMPGDGWKRKGIK